MLHFAYPGTCMSVLDESIIRIHILRYRLLHSTMRARPLIACLDEIIPTLVTSTSSPKLMSHVQP